MQDRFRALDVDLRLVAFVGIFSSLEEENVAIALMGRAEKARRPGGVWYSLRQNTFNIRGYQPPDRMILE